MLHTLYRISDGGNKKNKLAHADKLCCLKNYINVFGKEELTVFADNCTAETIAALKELQVTVINLNGLGNAQSFLSVLDYAIKNFSDEDNIYFLEDDYLHLSGAKEILLEGLQIADYVTLYDSPDKYVSFDKGGPNHYVIDNGEFSKVLLTKNSHWKITGSTTMTFASKVKNLKDDYKEWSFYQTQDYLAFQRIANFPLKLSTGLQVLKNKLSNASSFKHRLKIIYQYCKNIWLGKKRILIVSIPGRATHTEVEYLSPLTNWGEVG